MDVYLKQLLGSSTNHDYFYTSPTVIAAYKNYIRQFVGRYVNEPGILAWELVNEPRCTGSPGYVTVAAALVPLFAVMNLSAIANARN
jgi:mannan endo-1,4-beta-mannosidase